MQIKGNGIILEKKKIGENSLLVKLFTQDQGIVHGAINNAHSKQNARIAQLGNLVNFTWQARLIEHLGVFKIELVRPISFKIFSSQFKMHIIQSMLAIIAFALPEGVCEQPIYNRLIEFLDKLSYSDELGTIYMDYLQFEIMILSDLGFKIDVDSCAVTNKTDNLFYISPKTGRAVTKEIGLAFHDKLFILPDYFVSPRTISLGEMLIGLRITGYFLQKNIFHLKRENSLEIRDNLIRHIESKLIVKEVRVV